MTDTNQLIERLRGDLAMSMFALKADLYREQERQRSEAADALAAQQKRIEELEAALEPFAFITSETTQEAWEIRYQDRFADWIDYEDISAARAALAGKGETG